MRFIDFHRILYTVMLGTFPEDVDEYFGSGEVEEVKNELEKLVKQDEKENKEISRQ